MRLSLLSTMLACLFMVNAQAAELAVGKSVPPFSIKTLDGKLTTAATSKGKVLVINVWATWCEPCRKEMPEIEAFYSKYHPQGVDVIAISMDDRNDLEQVRAVMQTFSFPAALARDADIDGFGRIWRVPVTFIIDQNGMLRRNGWESEPLVDAAILEKTVLPLLIPSSPKDKTSQP